MSGASALLCRRVAIAVAVAGLLFGWPRRGHAHEDPEDQIHALSHEIDHHHGRDPEHLQRRGMLELERGDVAAAVADFERARALDPDLPFLDFMEGRARLAAGDAVEALSLLDRAVERAPRDPNPSLVRARALAALELIPEAAAEMERAIALMERPAPRHVLDLAALHEEAGSPERAVAALTRGMERLGPVATLVLEAVTLEQERGRYAAALAFAGRLPANVLRTPKWALITARLLAHEGRHAEAKRVVRAALAHLEALPPNRRDAPRLRALAEELAKERVALSREPGTRRPSRKVVAAAAGGTGPLFASGLLFMAAACLWWRRRRGPRAGGTGHLPTP